MTQSQQPSALPDLPRPAPQTKDPNYVAPPRDPDRPGPLIQADVITLEGHVKQGFVQGFTVLCDEASTGALHGTDQAPSPLGYFTLGMGF